MFVAVVLAHVGRVLARKAATPAAKRTRLLICFGLATLLIVRRHAVARDGRRPSAVPRYDRAHPLAMSGRATSRALAWLGVALRRRDRRSLDPAFRLDVRQRSAPSPPRRRRFFGFGVAVADRRRSSSS